MNRKEYALTDEQYKSLILALDSARRQPVMLVGGVGPRSPQAVANDLWGQLGREMGFDGMSVQPMPGKSERYFTAVPVPVPLPDRGRINLVFDRPPGPVLPGFIEAEDACGNSIRVGEWHQEGAKWVLVIKETS